MSNVTPINRHQQARTNGHNTGRLTSAHRCTIARLQELAIDISQHTEHYVTVQYDGHTHEISVQVTPYSHAESGNYKPTWSRHVYLPSSFYNAEDDRSLKMLGEIAHHLETLLPKPPTGGAA